MVMDFIRNSDLKQMLKLMSRTLLLFLEKLEPKTVRFYAAEIVNIATHAIGVTIGFSSILGSGPHNAASWGARPGAQRKVGRPSEAPALPC